MGYFEDAKELVGHAAAEIVTIEGEYTRSLNEKEVKPRLLIEIKNLMENLRSALDFTAHGLFDKYGGTTKRNPRIYFPYAPVSQDLAGFREQKRIEACIPGLPASRPDIAEHIEALQHFSEKENRWLPMFMDLNNENKHQQLTPQRRTERKERRLESGGASMSMGSGARISIGPGASMTIGGMKIPGGQEISADKPAFYTGQGTQTVTLWVSFVFTSNDQAVVPFLQKATTRTTSIVEELSVL